MRYALRLGLTKRPAEYESVKFEYEQEYDDEVTPREAAWADLKAYVCEKLDEGLSIFIEKYMEKVEETIRPSVKPFEEGYPATILQTPQPTESKPMEYYYPQVEKLEWRAFKEKRPAEPDEKAWLFSNTPGMEDLVNILRREGAVFVRMNQRRFICKLSGDKDLFINRIPQEKKEDTKK